MGYANPEQVGSGLLMRLYSQAFIVADLDDSRRVVFVSADIGMVSQRLRLEVRGWKRMSRTVWAVTRISIRDVVIPK